MDPAAHYIRQAGAVPVRDGAVCLVTSSNGKRWVVPKGIIDPGHTAGECALVESWEEAGLVGVLEREPVGSYVYEKWGGTCHVTVFLMQVTDAAEEWPERGQRQRRWVPFDEAPRWIDDPGLREVLRAAVARGSQQGA
jgi:8-oxo-dGTP pyrophosphatase MutT (NUDIX family)